MKSALVIATLAATSYAAKVRQTPDDATAATVAAPDTADANDVPSGFKGAIYEEPNATAATLDANADATAADATADATATTETDISAGVSIESTADADATAATTATETAETVAPAQIDYTGATETVVAKPGSAAAAEMPIRDAVEELNIEDPVVAPTFADIEQAKVAQPDVMVWSEEEIQAWTQSNLGNQEWDSVKQQHLLSADAREAYTTGIVNQLVQQWSQSISGWPAVCESGLQCRKDRFGVLMTSLKDDWDSALESIDRIIGNKIAKTKTILEASWEAAYNCDDGCECEDIDVVYGHIITTQERITKEIVTLKGELKTYIEEETEILEYCPEYADVDGSYVYKVYDQDKLHYSEDGETVVGSDVRAEAFATE